MADCEKVMKGLKCCILRNPDDHARCSQCSYGGNCVNRLKMDALELLDEQQETISSLQVTIRKLSAALEEKAEQEPVKPKYTTKSIYSWKCGVCNEPFDRTANYCSQCGRPVKCE